MLRFFIAVGVMLLSVVSNVYAMPAFARQMGVSCNTCHSQNGFPALNAYCRDFKASGFTLMGRQGTIDDPEKVNFLSLPETLNASFVTKINYTKDDSSKPVLGFPADAGLMIGGRVSDHVGAFAEIGYDGETNTFGLANFKLPVTYKVGEYTVGVVPYRTDGFGPSYAFEALNTGGDILESTEVISAQQYIGTGSEAEGLGLYLYNKLWYAVYSAWMPVNGSIQDFSPAHYLRVAVTPTIGEWDLGFGGQLWFGTAKYQDNNNITGPRIEEKTDAYALDFQAMGDIANVPVSFFVTYADAKKDANSLYSPGDNNKKAATFLTEVGVIPYVLNLSAGYRNADNGDPTNSSDNAAIAGLKYFLFENVEFQLNDTHNFNDSASRNQFLFMLYAAF
jgi:hypothetical protein